MISQKVGQVTEDEKNKLLTLYERRLAIEELEISIKDNSFFQDNDEKIKEKINKEKLKNNQEFNEWWIKKSHKYNWESSNSGFWNIDFITNAVYLNINSL